MLPTIIQITLLLMAVPLLSLSVPGTALAAVEKIDGGWCAYWGIWCTGDDTPLIIINYIWFGINVVLSLLATVAAAALVYYGVMYVMSQGEENKAQQAKTGIVYAVVGIFVVGLAAWVVNAILNL